MAEPPDKLPEMVDPPPHGATTVILILISALVALGAYVLFDHNMQSNRTNNIVADTSAE